MATAPFADLQTRLNGAVRDHLANAVATVDGVSVAGTFVDAYAVAEVGGGMASSQPMLTIATTSVPASPIGKTVVVNSISYTIQGHEPDGCGDSVLMLETA